MTTPLDRAAVPPLFFTTEASPGFANPYGVHGASEHILMMMMEEWRISKYLFSHLLGIERDHNFRNYFNGNKRPSPLILERAIILGKWHQAEFQLVLMRSVDWEPDPIVIHWFDGSESSPDAASGTWQSIPSPSGKPDVTVAGYYRQRKVRPTPHSPGRPHFRQRSPE